MSTADITKAIDLLNAQRAALRAARAAALEAARIQAEIKKLAGGNWDALEALAAHTIETEDLVVEVKALTKGCTKPVDTKTLTADLTEALAG